MIPRFPNLSSDLCETVFGDRVHSCHVGQVIIRHGISCTAVQSSNPIFWCDAMTRAARPNANPLPADLMKWLATLVRRSRGRANRDGLDHDIPDDHAVTLFQEQQGRCAITGRPFNLVRFPGTLVKHPFAPSLHRRRASKGYVRGNVVLVCIAANFGMGEWGEEIYWSLAHAAVANEQWTEHMRRRRQSRLLGTDWKTEQTERIAVAELIATTLSGSDRQHQNRHVASLKRTLVLGPTGLKNAADRAVVSRRSTALRKEV
jgi:hypothetical protein